MNDTMRDAAWKLVPVEPDKLMLVKGENALHSSSHGDFHATEGEIEACYRAMLEAAPAPPVPEDGPMMVRGTNANGTKWMGTMRQVMEDYKQAAEIEAREADRLRQRIAELESPPVPSSVQEIMPLVNAYVRACGEFLISGDDSADEALKPLQAALTTLVDDNHRLQFELDGVRAMRGPLTDEQITTGFVEWSFCRFPNGVPTMFDRSDCETAFKAGVITATHGIEPEHGEVKS